jgi:hypothetical protein
VGEGDMKKSDKRDWKLIAAAEIEKSFAAIIERNTRLRKGYFFGLSLQDIAAIIEKHRPKRRVI